MPWNLLGKKPARPLPGGNRLQCRVLPCEVEDDKARQVVRLRAQAVKQPRAHARPALDDGAGVHEGVGRVVVDLLGVHRADDAQVVGHAGDVREQVGNFLPGLAVFL